MKKIKVIKVNADSIEFDNGMSLYSYHEDSCCETHYLCFKDLSLEDFKDLEFPLSEDNDIFFNRIVDYGIGLIPVNGWPVRIPGYGINNGCYSEQLDLIFTDGANIIKKYDITDCQVVKEPC